MALGQGGWTALHLAAQKNSFGVAEKLLDAKAKVDTTNNVRAGCSCVMLCGDCVIVGQAGETALHQAAYKNNSGMADFLLGAGASVGIKDKVRADCVLCAECVALGQDGWTALHLAAQQNSCEVAKLLLEAKPPNKWDDELIFAPARIKNNVRAGCRLLDAVC